MAEVAANNRFSPQRRKLGYLPQSLKGSNNQNGENDMICIYMAIVILYAYHAPGTVARLSNGQKNHYNAFRCALNTETKTK